MLRVFEDFHYASIIRVAPLSVLIFSIRMRIFFLPLSSVLSYLCNFLSWPRKFPIIPSHGIYILFIVQIFIFHHANRSLSFLPPPCNSVLYFSTSNGGELILWLESTHLQKLFARSRLHFQRNFRSRLIRFRGEKRRNFHTLLSHFRTKLTKEEYIERVEEKKKRIIVTLESILKASFLLFPSAHPFSTKTPWRKQVPSFLLNLILRDRDELFAAPFPPDDRADRWKHGGGWDLVDRSHR